MDGREAKQLRTQVVISTERETMNEEDRIAVLGATTLNAAVEVVKMYDSGDLWDAAKSLLITAFGDLESSLDKEKK
jgi:hypothetical protein